MQYVQNKYFSENSPRILFYGGNTKNFLQEIKATEVEYVYGNPLYTSFIIFKFFLNNFHLKDFFIFASGILKYKFKFENITLQDWINSQKFSNTAIKAITTFCITIIDHPKRTNIYDFFGAFSLETVLTEVKQMKYPNKWHEIIEKQSNITFHKKCNVISLKEYNNKISSIICIKDGHTFELKAKNFVLCTQSSGLLSLLENSNDTVKSNWMPYTKMREWCNNTFYVAFGFQLHFHKKFNLPHEWCWSCMGEWSVIVLDVSKYAKNFSKDENVVSTLSCCIVDTETKSTFLNKTANECKTKTIVIDEALRQMNIKRLDVYKVTTSYNLTRKNEKWISNTTGFTRNKYGLLEIKGKIDNLYALGCFTTTNKPVIANFNVALDATASFLNKYEPKVNSFHNKPKTGRIIFICILILAFLLLIKKLL